MGVRWVHVEGVERIKEPSEISISSGRKSSRTSITTLKRGSGRTKRQMEERRGTNHHTLVRFSRGARTNRIVSGSCVEAREEEKARSTQRENS